MELSASGGGAQALENISREEGWGFDIQFHIRGADLDVDTIREKISSMGESALIVGDTSLIKVHVHAPFPGAIIDYGVSCGMISNVILENMQEQYIDFMAQQSSPKPRIVKAEDLAGISTIAVAPGAGIARVFESLGVGTVISGGQTMNPSTQDILNAIEKSKVDKIIILPNNKNIIPAAQQAKALSKKKVEIVPTQTIPQGIAAMIGFNYQNDLLANVNAMARAAANVQTAEITTAIRSVSLDGIDVKEGQVIGLIDGALVGAGEDRAQMTMSLLNEMRTGEKEIITMFYGESVTANEAGELADQIRREYPSQEVEMINGGQPHYHYILSVE
jgi:hypothetical protein